MDSSKKGVSPGAVSAPPPRRRDDDDDADGKTPQDARLDPVLAAWPRRVLQDHFVNKAHPPNPPRPPRSSRRRSLHASPHPDLDTLQWKDTAFTPDERRRYNLEGLLPPAVQDRELQMRRALEQLRAFETPLQRHVYLSELRATNLRLFYALAMQHMEEVLPLIYTPTVADACRNFSHIYRRPEGLSLTIEDKGKVAQILENWPVPAASLRIACVTSGERILGIGDQGFDGLGICIGKLALYVAAAGIHPRATLPIVIDVGTNNKAKLEDPLYLGLRRKRASHDETVSFVDEVMSALRAKFPNLVVQFEDWATEQAFELLERHKSERCFNDDIQGTGAVILGGFINAARMSSKASGRALHDQRILFFGAGSAGVGVAKQLTAFFTRQGLSADEARERIWLVDSKGLVSTDRGDVLPEHKRYFARREGDNAGGKYRSLSECVSYVKPTALVGLSTVAGAFDEEVLRKMAQLNKRPIIFPLSNPSSYSECDFATAVRATQGACIFAAGSPFAECDHDGRRMIPGQGNNLYVFPGIGFGAALCKTRVISDAMITDAALALADSLTDEEKREERIYPNLRRIREISRDVACRVIKRANVESHSRDKGYTASMTDEELSDWVEGEAWRP